MKVVVACAQDIIVNLLEAAVANDNGRKLMVMMITINANEDIKVDCIAVVGRFLNNGECLHICQPPKVSTCIYTLSISSSSRNTTWRTDKG